MVASACLASCKISQVDIFVLLKLGEMFSGLHTPHCFLQSQHFIFVADFWLFRLCFKLHQCKDCSCLTNSCFVSNSLEWSFPWKLFYIMKH